MEEEISFKAECVCGSTHFMQEDGKTFCMECQTELESAKEIVYEAVDYMPDIGDLTQRSRVLTTTVKQKAGKRRVNNPFDREWGLLIRFNCSQTTRTAHVMGVFQSNIV